MTNKKQAAYQYGIRAEQLAILYLRLKGHRIISHRYRNHWGEIDIIAKKSRTLIAIEVKARQSLKDCAESVPPAKQAKIARSLEGFLAGHHAITGKSSGLAYTAFDNIRFDVIWISPRHWPVHIKDAWQM